jgi:peroxiredoxin
LFAASLLVGAGLLSAATVPRPLPAFSFVLPGGKTVDLAAYKGKVLVVEIMSTTCPHCQNSARVLARLNTELGPKGFQPVAVAINEDADIGAFIKTYGVNFPLGTAKRDDAFALAQHSVMQGPFYFPTMLFIDKKGQIRAQYNGTQPFLGPGNEERNIRELVNTLLAEPGAPKAAPAAKKSRKAS